LDGSAPPTIVVHGLAHALAALAAAREAGVAVRLASAPGAAAFAGAGWFAALLRAAADAVPGAAFEAVLDCGDAPGHALAALRAGITRIALVGRPRAVRAVAAIAVQQDAAIDRRRGVRLDLGDAADPPAAARQFLANFTH